METYRLKNIAIAVLLLLNGGLLLLLGWQQLQARQTAEAEERELRRLYEANQLVLGDEVKLTQQPLSPLTLVRDGETEKAIASFLLGGDAPSSSQGGGILSYEGERGSVQFRAGGSFDGSRLALDVEDPAGFAQRFFQQFGYQDPQILLRGPTGSATATQQVAGVTVYGCGVTLFFEQGTLTAASGAHVSLENALVESGQTMTCVTALVRFLDHRSAAGIVCSRVTGVSCVYRLQTAAAPPRLPPPGNFSTDTTPYFVDCATGEVARA